MVVGYESMVVSLYRSILMFLNIIFPPKVPANSVQQMSTGGGSATVEVAASTLFPEGIEGFGWFGSWRW